MNSNDEMAAFTKGKPRERIDPPPIHTMKKKSVLPSASNANVKQSSGLEPEEMSKKVLPEKGGKTTLEPSTKVSVSSAEKSPKAAPVPTPSASAPDPVATSSPANIASTSVHAPSTSVHAATADGTPTKLPTSKRDPVESSTPVASIKQTFVHPNGSVTVIDEKDPRVQSVLKSSPGLDPSTAAKIVFNLMLTPNFTTNANSQSTPSTSPKSKSVRWSEICESDSEDEDAKSASGSEGGSDDEYEDFTDADTDDEDVYVGSF